MSVHLASSCVFVFPAKIAHGKNDNVKSANAPAGDSRAYTLNRLKREASELFERVKAGVLSANAANNLMKISERKTRLANT